MSRRSWFQQPSPTVHRDAGTRSYEAFDVTEPEQTPLLPAEELSAVETPADSRQADRVNGPSSTIGIGTGMGIGCLVLIVLLVVFGFVARSAGWL